LPDADRLSAELEEIRGRNEDLIAMNARHGWSSSRINEQDVCRLLAALDKVLKLADKWDADALAMREKFAREVHPALAHGHKEANALNDLARELREAISRALTGEDGTDG
jgi:hypothetical protein